MSWLDALLGGIKQFKENGSARPVRKAVNIIGATIVDNPGAEQLDITFTGSHGNQPGGALHAVATTSVAGFMAPADKTKLDAATVAPTPNTIPLRDAGGQIKAVYFEGQGLGAPAGEDLEIAAESGQVITMFASDLVCSVESFKVRDLSAADRLQVVTLPAATMTWGATCTSVIDSITKRGSTGANAGAPRSISAQDGQNVAAGTNNSGGNLVLRSGAVGTGGSGGGNGSVTIGTGATDRITCTTTDIAINANGTCAITGAVTCSSSVAVTGALTSAQQSTPINAQAFVAAGMTLDARVSNHHEIAAMTANLATLNMTNAAPGSIHTIEFLMNGTGGWLVTAWNANFKFGTTYTNAPFADPNHRTIFTFKVRSATDIRCIGKEVYTS